MSTAPSGAHPPPLGRHPAASVRWRITHSLWLALPFVGLGCLGGAGFVYVGLRARRPSWWIAGLVYIAVGVVGLILIDEPGETTTVGNWVLGAFVAAWLASIVHACLINSAWLRWRASRTPWHTQPAPPPTWRGGPYSPVPPGPPTSAPLSGDELISDPTHDPGRRRVATTLPTVHQPPTIAAPPGPIRAGPSDVKDLPYAPPVQHTYSPRPIRPARTRTPWNNRDRDVANWLTTPFIALAIGAMTSGGMFYAVIIGSALSYDSTVCGDACPDQSHFGTWFVNTAIAFPVSLVMLWFVPWWRGLRRLRYGLAAAAILIATLVPIVMLSRS